MSEGVIQQIGNPTDIYNEPKNAFVADFIGESNIIDGIMIRDKQVRFGDYSFECVDSGFGEYTPVHVVVRPEDIMVVAADEGMLQGIVRSVTFKGVHYEMLVEAGDYVWMLHNTVMQPEGATIGLVIMPNDIHIMKKEVVRANES